MARTDGVWEILQPGGYIKPISDTGYDILVFGSNKYLNFNSISGSSGYGFRDNAGVMEYKNSGGTWAGIGSGGGGGGGITTLNTLTGATQTFAVGTAGTDFTITSTGTTHTFNIPDGSSTTRGFVTPAMVTAFDTAINSKFTLPALTSGSVLFSNGTTIVQDNTRFFYDVVNGRLGVGTNAPSTVFHVVGASTLAGATSISGGLTVSSGGATLTGNVSVTGILNGTSINATATVNLGSGTGTFTHGLGAASTISGATKTLNIATGGLAGSTTTVNIGSLAGTSTMNVLGRIVLVTTGSGNLTLSTDGSSNAVITNTNGNIFIGNNQTTIRGAGATNATFSAIFQNSAGTQAFAVRNDSAVLIGTDPLIVTSSSNTTTFTSTGNYRFTSSGYGDWMSFGAVIYGMTFFGAFTGGHPTSGTRVIAHHSGGASQSAPTTNVTDSYQIYAADINGVNGTTAMHTRAENGTVIKHYQETTAVASATIVSPGAGNVVKTDDTFDGYTLAQIVRALRLKGELA